jgi:hypothetical protein
VSERRTASGQWAAFDFTFRSYSSQTAVWVMVRGLATKHGPIHTAQGRRRAQEELDAFREGVHQSQFCSFGWGERRELMRLDHGDDREREEGEAVCGYWRGGVRGGRAIIAR